MAHVNIRGGLKQKVMEISGFCKSENIDIVAITETLQKQDVKIPGFHAVV